MPEFSAHVLLGESLTPVGQLRIRSKLLRRRSRERTTRKADG